MKENFSGLRQVLAEGKNEALKHPLITVAFLLLSAAACKLWITLAEMAGAQSPLPHP